MSNEQACKNPIEDQRKQALEHYRELATKCCHWSSFVENAIKAYNPESPQHQGELKNNAELFWHKHRQTFKGINAGDYIDKEDWDKFIDTLPAGEQPPAVEGELVKHYFLDKETVDEIQQVLSFNETNVELAHRQQLIESLYRIYNLSLMEIQEITASQPPPPLLKG